MLKYDLEFRFIPYIVDAFNAGKIPEQALIDIQWWEYIAGEMGNVKNTFSFSDITATPVVLGDNRKVILYTLPEPEFPPDAKYAAVILEHDGKGRYITLESEIDPNIWFLGGQEGDRHNNLGKAPECQTLDDFAKLIEERFLGGRVERKVEEDAKKDGFLRKLFRK